MNKITSLFERLKLAFPDEDKRSFKAATIIVNIGRLVPPSYIYPLPPPSTSEERLEFISFILKQETGINYSSQELLTAHNVLLGSDIVQKELSLDIGIDKVQYYLKEYKQTNPQSGFGMNFIPTLLLPHRNSCTICNKQLRVIFQGFGKILFCTRIEQCLIYKADCHPCRRSYRVSSIYSMDRREIIMTYTTQKANYVHFSGSLVFAKEYLVSFSSQLIHNYVTFEGFAAATIKTLQRLQPENDELLTRDSLARILQGVWLYYELANLIFMTSKSTEVSFPSALVECRITCNGKQSSRAIFIERNLNWIYHVFTVFWSNHRILFGNHECSHCSRVMIIDGHQKPRRSVCRYDNVTSILNVEELGPINKGCPYKPSRRKSDKTKSDDLLRFYCGHHQTRVAQEQSLESKMSDKELEKYLRYLKKLDCEESQCNVGRSDIEERFEMKKQSMGFIATFLNCGIIIGFSDSVNHEGPRKVTDHLLTMLKLGSKLPSLLVYDAACQLHQFWNYHFNTEHMRKTKYTEQLMKMKVVTDRFHNTVHKGKLCKTVFNPDSDQNKHDFIDMNTSVAEQTFSYLTKFKFALSRFSYPTSALFTILIFHLKNCDKLNQDPSQQGIVIGTTVENDFQQQGSCQNYCIFETLSLERNIDQNQSQISDEFVNVTDHEDKI